MADILGALSLDGVLSLERAGELARELAARALARFFFLVFFAVAGFVHDGLPRAGVDRNSRQSSQIHFTLRHAKSDKMGAIPRV
jgi:hypothetical protein